MNNKGHYGILKPYELFSVVANKTEKDPANERDGGIHLKIQASMSILEKNNYQDKRLHDFKNDKFAYTHCLNTILAISQDRVSQKNKSIYS